MTLLLSYSNKLVNKLTFRLYLSKSGFSFIRQINLKSVISSSLNQIRSHQKEAKNEEDYCFAVGSDRVSEPDSL